jgi:hypothetical protein
MNEIFVFNIFIQYYCWCNIPWWYEFIWCVPSDDDIYHKMLRHIIFHVIIFYDESICHKCITTSAAIASQFMKKFFVTTIFLRHLPCGLPPDQIYDICFRHNGFAMSHTTSSPLAMWQCMVVWTMTFSECHRFSDESDVGHKIYDDFLMIIIIIYLTRTFCDDDLFVTMASPKYNLWQINTS